MILDTDKLISDGAYREDMRHRVLTDHFFLAPLLGFHDFVRAIHQPAVDLYFPKNPKLTIPEQHYIKNRMHLDPRHTFKTCLGRVDTVQWICAFPELITIVNVGATQPLAKAISEVTAKYFYQPKGKAPTALQLLFPEIVQSSMPEAPWNTINHKWDEMDFTIAYTSPKTAQAGWHPWIIQPDDMVDAVNSGIDANADVRQGVINTYNTNKNALRFGGYINMRGTRYHPFDAYGHTLDKMDPEEWKILIRGSLTVKSGVRLVPGEFPQEEELELNFPGMLPYKKLRQLFMEDYQTFMCQQQNDPQGGSVPTFDEKLYSSALCPPDKIPPTGDTVMCWRLPYGGKPYMATYAEGAVARIRDGKVCVLDAWQGIYTPSGLAEKIIRESKRHEAEGLMMEAAPGTEYMAAHIRNEAVKKNTSIRIQWLEYEEDDNRRSERIKQLEPFMRVGRLLLSTAITRSSELHKQFVHFGLVEENGIVDCVSRLAERVPISMLRANMGQEELENQARRRENVHYQAVFGQAGAAIAAEEARRQQTAHLAAMEKANTNVYGLPALPGGLDG